MKGVKPPREDTASQRRGVGLARQQDTMQLGDRVRTRVALPGIPTGALGQVKETGRRFVAIGFPDGRLGYYAPQQLELVGSCGFLGRGDSTQEVAFGINDLRVPLGSHFCLLPVSLGEAMELVASFLAAGLEAGERCFCALPKARTDDLARAEDKLSAEGRDIPWDELTLLDVWELYLDRDRFVAEKQLERLEGMARSAAAGEHTRLRGFGYVPPVLAKVDPAQWWRYEEQVTPVCERLGLTAMCGYAPSRTESTAWGLAVKAHPYVVRGKEVAPGGWMHSQ